MPIGAHVRAESTFLLVIVAVSMWNVALYAKQLISHASASGTAGTLSPGLFINSLQFYDVDSLLTKDDSRGSWKAIKGGFRGAGAMPPLKIVRSHGQAASGRKGGKKRERERARETSSMIQSPKKFKPTADELHRWCLH